MTPAYIGGSPYSFLYKRFPTWKEDSKTYMIPPNFTVRSQGHQVEGSGSKLLYSNIDDIGESIMYNLLQELGELQKIGMFVIHRLELQRKSKCRMSCLVDEDLVPDLLQNEGSDFTIFHHALGIISMEVKSSISEVLQAEIQLEASYDLIEKLAKFNKIDDNFHLVHRKVIALPFSKPRTDFYGLKESTLLLFKDDAADIESFQNWWRESIESTSIQRVEKPYEQVLSYALMLRHLGPETETESMTFLRQAIVANKYHGREAFPQVIKKEFPDFWKWCWNILTKKDKAYSFGDGKPKDMVEAFAKRHQISAEDLKGLKGLKLLDNLLKHQEYVAGDIPSAIDETLAVLFDDTYFLFFSNIRRFINQIRKMLSDVEDGDSSSLLTDQEKYPFLRLESVTDLNQLDRHLSSFSFIKGDKPTVVDRRLFETLTCQMRAAYARLPHIMTTQQLIVFGGPCKQLIVGPPGSGKTELMKFKALQLEAELRACKSTKRILYIVANASPQYKKSLFYYQMEEFFKVSTLVTVTTVILKREHPEDLKNSVSFLREIISSKEYVHVFIDEYWIGSKSEEHAIILELVDQIQGYVWISSVFDFNTTYQKYLDRTKPLVDSIERNGGVVSRLTKVLRGTNNIIDLERGHSSLYRGRSHPYGTELIEGHSLEGSPITWAVEKDIHGMYTRCADIIDSALKETMSHTATEKLALDYADIMIVNFAVRANDSHGLDLKNYLQHKKIPVWTFEDDHKQYLKCANGKVTLLQSPTRDASSFLDGVEWPMVIVILPSGVLLKTAVMADGAEKLRSYDPYISLFRSMVRLVVISDKWHNKEEFLKDIEARS